MNDTTIAELKRELTLAVRAGDTETVVSLLSRQDELLVATTYVGTWLHEAADQGHGELVARLIEMGLDVNVECELGVIPLRLAAGNGHIHVVEQLIRLGADTRPDNSNRNAMFSAIHNSQPAVVSVLLKNGFDADVVYRSVSGNLKNAFSYASERGETEIVQLLSDAGCRMPVEDVDVAINEPATASPNAGTDNSQIIDRMTSQFGPVEPLTLQGIVPVDDEVNIAVNIIKPSDESPYLTLFTTGMSDRAMTVPAGQEDYQYAELVMYLPSSWTIPTLNDPDEASLWPFQWLRNIACYPHQADTWLGGPHTIIASDDPPAPLGPGTKQTCLFLAADYAEWSPMELDDARTVRFYTVIPIYTDERDLEVKHGVHELIERFQTRGVTPIVDVTRESVANDAKHEHS